METETIFPFSNDSEFGRKESYHQEQEDMVQLINVARYYVNGKVGVTNGNFILTLDQAFVSCQKSLWKNKR